MQEGLNKATGNLAAGLIFTGLKVGEVTFFARTISGFSVGGSALLERGTLRVNISVLARTRQGGTLRGVLRGFEKEAGRLGAQKLVIRGTLPKSTLTSAKAKELAEKLGFIFRQADDGSILLIK